MNSVCSILRLSVVGTTIALAAGQVPHAAEPTAIFVMKTDGSEVRRVADVQGYEQHGSPRWSHDGRRLAFDVAKADGAKTDVNDGRWFLANADGSGAREMGRGTHPDWSPDDKQLVFAVGPGTPVKQGIWVQNDDGQGRVWLAAGNCPRWSPRDGALAILDGDALAVLDLIDVEQKKLNLPAGAAPGFDWSPDGRRLAYVTANEGKRALWIANMPEGDAPTKLTTGDLDGTVAWSPDGKRLAIALGGQIQLLTADGMSEPQPISAQEGVNRMPAWSADGEWLAFVSTRTSPALAPVAHERRTVRMEEVKRHTRGHIVYTFALSSDGRRAFLPGRRDLAVLNLDDFTQTILPLHGEGVALSPDERLLAVCGATVKIELGKVDDGELVRTLHVGSMCNNAEFSPDGGRVVSSSINKQAVVWDVATGKQLLVFKNHNAPLTRVAFFPNGELVASVGQDRTLRVWNATTGAEQLVIPYNDVPWGLAVSPDGRLLAVGTGGPTDGNPLLQRIQAGQENIVQILDVNGREVLHEMHGHTNVVYAIDFSPDGRTLATGSWDGTIRLWDVATGGHLATAEGRGSAYAVGFTPDGAGLLVGGGENRSAGGRMLRFPDEQLRIYRIIEGELAQAQ